MRRNVFWLYTIPLLRKWNLTVFYIRLNSGLSFAYATNAATCTLSLMKLTYGVIPIIVHLSLWKQTSSDDTRNLALYSSLNGLTVFIQPYVKTPTNSTSTKSSSPLP